MGVHHVGRRRSEESAPECAVGHGAGCAGRGRDLHRHESHLRVRTAVGGDRHSRNHCACGSRGLVLARCSGVAVADDCAFLLQRSGDVHALRRARLSRHGAGWRLLQAHGGDPSQVAHASIQPDRTRRLGRNPHPQRPLRPALYICDLRHGAVLYADSDGDVLAALEAPGDSAPLPVHWISVAACDLCPDRRCVDLEHHHPAATGELCEYWYRVDRCAFLFVLEAQQPKENSLSNPRSAMSNPSQLLPGVSIVEAKDANRPKQVMGFRDLVLFYVITGISLRWIATAAAAGPSSIVIWVGAWFGFYTPLALSVIELSSRYPDEGGLYVWSKHAFGDFAGFMSAWTYWTSNLPYFPAVLYFAASNILYVREAQWGHLSLNPAF